MRALRISLYRDLKFLDPSQLDLKKLLLDKKGRRNLGDAARIFVGGPVLSDPSSHHQPSSSEILNTLGLLDIFLASQKSSSQA